MFRQRGCAHGVQAAGDASEAADPNAATCAPMWTAILLIS
jgi:hypothetical protein